MNDYSKRLQFIGGVVALILFIPLIAMQLTDEVNWGVMDFVVAGLLLLCTGILLDYVWRKVDNRNYRMALCLAVLGILFLVWAELAVGIL